MRSKAKNLPECLSLVESLESRQLLSTAVNIHLKPSSNPADIGNTETFTATVTSADSSNETTPSGSVKFKDGSTLLEKVALTNGVATFSTDNFFTGAHDITAKYMGDANFAAGVSIAKTLTVIKGSLQTESDGLQVATYGTGTGAAVVTDDGVQVNYAGFIAATGENFQTSMPGSPLSTTDNPSDLIQGFAEGLVGLQQGQTRVLYIPAAIGYGSTANNGIPANSRLVFIISLAAAPVAPQLVITGANSETISNGEAASTADGTVFENVSVGSSSGPLSISLSDATSGSGLSFTKQNGIVVAGADPADFTTTADSSGTFTITFSPTATGLRTAKIKIFTDDPTNPTFVLYVQGTGL